MTQADFTVANQTFPNTRAEINTSLQALATNSAGNSAPSTTFANQWWFDSDGNILYMRNKDDDAWVSILTIGATSDLQTVTTDLIAEVTADAGVTIDSLLIKDGKIANLMNATLSASDLGSGVHIKTGDSGGSANANSDELILEGSGSNASIGMGILSPTDGFGYITFGDSGGNAMGGIRYDHTNNDMEFYTNDSLACSIDANGNFMRQAAGAVSIRVGSTNAGGASILLDGDSNGDFSGSDYSGIFHDTAGRLDIVQDSPSGTNQIRFMTAGSSERLRIDHDANISTRGESAPDTTKGFCINQGDADGSILTFKSSDVAHLMTASAETDTFLQMGKNSAANGGIDIFAYSSRTDGEYMRIGAHGHGISTTKSTSGVGAYHLFVANRSGTGVSSLASNSNLLTLASYIYTRFIFDAEGDFHADSSSTTFDAYDDAQLVRAYDLSHKKGVIDSKFDKFVAYNHEKLAELKLVGREKDGTPNNMVSVTGMQRLHNGAIWQQYEKHQKLANAFYKLAEKTIGKEEADKLLTDEEIQLLN